jgi:hypothetical protein
MRRKLDEQQFSGEGLNLEQINALSVAAVADGTCVLVQREMEKGRSPLV